MMTSVEAGCYIILVTPMAGKNTFKKLRYYLCNKIALLSAIHTNCAI